MSAGGVHDQRLIGADPVQICLAHILLVFHPSRGHIEGAPGILLYKFFDDLPVSVIVRQTHLRQVRLPDQAVAGQIAVGMGFQKSRINEVFSVIKHLSVRIGQFLCIFHTADKDKHTVFRQYCFGKGSLFIHCDNVAEDQCLFHAKLLSNVRAEKSDCRHMAMATTYSTYFIPSAPFPTRDCSRLSNLDLSFSLCSTTLRIIISLNKEWGYTA